MKPLSPLSRRSAAFAATLAAGAALLAGCSTDRATKAVEQVDEAPNVYGQAINRAKAVAGTEEQHGSADYLNRQTGANSGDDGGALPGEHHHHRGQEAGAPGMGGAPGAMPGGQGMPTVPTTP